MKKITETAISEMALSKELLEGVIPAAQTKNNDVFNSILPTLEEAAAEVAEDMLGETGVTAMHDNEDILRHARIVTCLRGFRQAMSSLDMVLTATGFGVVNTQDTAPASKARVDALRADLELQELRAIGHLTDELCEVDGWGDTTQAEDMVPNVFYKIQFLNRYADMVAWKAEDWRNAQAKINAEDTRQRHLISNSMMDALLADIRHGQLQGKRRRVVDGLRELIGFAISGYTDKWTQRFRPIQLLDYMEDNPDDFAPYIESKEYKARHDEGYQNTKDSSAFFFQG
jgi:hypothetical protein